MISNLAIERTVLASLPEMFDLVESIGTSDFSPRLIQFLHSQFGASHFAAFRFGTESIESVAFSCITRSRIVSAQIHRYVNEGWWQKDPAILSARQHLKFASAGLVRLQLESEAYSELRPAIYPNIRDAVMVCGRQGDVSFGLSVLCAAPHPEFSERAMTQLAQISSTLVSMMAKHVKCNAHQPNAASALTSLDEIEACFLARSAFPKRELEVCARILYGLSTLGISLDLNIGEESVKTYRKRAYQRLCIGSERELLQWYLREWSEWQAHRHLQTVNHLSKTEVH